ncbi:MAG: hypothetical protein COA33_012560 [Fluviicola sp.]|nr:hypothetical protein [Fluviicola sp.]
MSELKPYHFFLPIAFLVLLILPFLNDGLHFSENERNKENRNFTDSITVNVNNLDVLPENIDNYVNDNFSFRRPLLDLFHYTKFAGFKVSPHPDKVIIGKNNWFFNAGKEVAIYSGTNQFSNTELNLFSKEWEGRMHYFDSLNIQPYWIVAPFKHHVYSNQLPFYITQVKISSTQQVIQEISSKYPKLIIDPTERLILERDKKKLFFQLDNHWTYQAGEIVSEMFLEKVKKDFPNASFGEFSTPIWKDTLTRSGNHYDDLGIADVSETVQLLVNKNFKAKEIHKYTFKGIENFAYGYDYVHTFENTAIDSNGLRILIIRDSYANALMPFINDAFKESVWIFDAWQYQLNAEIIEKIKPDIVLFISLETHIDAIIKKYAETN